MVQLVLIWIGGGIEMSALVLFFWCFFSFSRLQEFIWKRVAPIASDDSKRQH